jgi:hypothetical protein
MFAVSEWKSSAMRTYDGPGCDCLACKFIGGDRSPECVDYVVDMLDEHLANAERAERDLMRAMIAMKEQHEN